MLKIRKEQIDALRKYMLDQFTARMAVHLRSAFPEQTIDMLEQNLHNMIQHGIDKASDYDIKLEDNVQRFLECMITYGRDFDHNPKTRWAGDILRRKDINGFMKMNLIDNHELFDSQD